MSNTNPQTDWRALSARVLAGEALDRPAALSILRAPDDELLDLLSATFAIRKKYFGRGVRLHLLHNAKSGLCSEDCAYCSQSAAAAAGHTPPYPLQSADEIAAGAAAATRVQAARYCIVMSGRAPDEPAMQTICDAVRRIKREHPRLQVCVSLGLLNDEQARRLKAAGVNRYNHNLETSRRFYPSICGTHSYDDRVNSARAAKRAGLELCSGGLLGMGETPEDRVELACALREIDADSVPVNLLDPRAGTRLAGRPRLSPTEGLRILAMFRFVLPDREIRIAGGREAVLGPLQPLGLFAANSIFTNGYLTTPGQGYAADLAMLAAAGFTVTEIQA